MADRLGVEQSTYSRWERGVQEPAPHHKRELERLSSYREPALCTRFMMASPVPKTFTELFDFSKHVAYSAGTHRMVEEAGGSIEAWAAEDYVSPMAAALNEIVVVDPRWATGDILFFEAKMLNQYGPDSRPLPVHVVGAPIHQLDLCLWEGAELPELTEPPHVILYISDDTTETVAISSK